MDIVNEFLSQRYYCVVDIETTGLNCRTDDIIEIAALKVEDDEITDSFSELIYTDKAISPFISELTGINNSMLDTADDISSVLCRFFDFVSDDIIIGHNIGFDMRFISYQSQLNFGTAACNQTLDTLKLAKAVLRDKKCHKLSFLKEYYHIPGSSHRALDDCKTTYELIKILTGVKIL